MNSETQHTPLPWKYVRTHGLSADRWYVITDAQGRGPIFEVGGHDEPGQIAVAAHLITDPERVNANAELIVRAVNSHAALVQALQELLDAIQNDMDEHDGRDSLGMACGRCDGALPIPHSLGCRAKQALSDSKAGGQ